MRQSAYKACVVVLAVSFVVVAAFLVAVMAVKQKTCLSQTQADPLGGLPASRIPAQCAAQFHQHVEIGLVMAGIISLLIAAVFTIWRLPSRRGKDLRSA
jgi:large-conductance mechanosensitive channel